MGSIVDKLRKRKGDRQATTLHFNDADAAEAFPELSELLYRAKTGKENRKAGSFRVFVDGGVLKVCLTAPTEGQVGFVVVDSLVGLVEALEGFLAGDRVDWREDTFRQRSR